MNRRIGIDEAIHTLHLYTIRDAVQCEMERCARRVDRNRKCKCLFAWRWEGNEMTGQTPPREPVRLLIGQYVRVKRDANQLHASYTCFCVYLFMFYFPFLIFYFNPSNILFCILFYFILLLFPFHISCSFSVIDASELGDAPSLTLMLPQAATIFLVSSECRPPWSAQQHISNLSHIP